MKMELFCFLVGLIMGLTAATTFNKQVIKKNPFCDHTEHSRLKIVLDECSSAAMSCAWKDSEYEIQ